MLQRWTCPPFYRDTINSCKQYTVFSYRDVGGDMLHEVDNCHIILAFECRLWLLAGQTDLTEGNWHFEMSQDTGVESESCVINIQLRPVSLSNIVFVWSKHHMQRQQIAVQRIVLSFPVLYNWINVASSWPFLPCSGLEIIGVTSFKDSYYVNEYVSGLVSGHADLISDSNKEQLSVKYKDHNHC